MHVFLNSINSITSSMVKKLPKRAYIHYFLFYITKSPPLYPLNPPKMNPVESLSSLVVAKKLSKKRVLAAAHWQTTRRCAGHQCFQFKEILPNASYG